MRVPLSGPDIEVIANLTNDEFRMGIIGYLQCGKREATHYLQYKYHYSLQSVIKIPAIETYAN